MTIEIEALDTLFFRDGKPFSMGDDTWANGMFPPLPSVLYGALRTAYMAQQNIVIDDIIEKTKELRIKQIFYKVKSKEDVNGLYYYPMPLDLVNETEPEKHLSESKKQEWKEDKRYSENTLKSFDIFSNSTIPNDLSSHLATLPKTSQKVLTYEKDIDIEMLDNGIIMKTALKEYIGGAKEIKAKLLTNSYKIEAKIGIGRQNETRTTEEGKLYRVNMLRPDNLKICIEFEGLDLEDKGLLRLGAENKLATYEKVKDTEISPINFEGIQEFKIYLATPAIFKQGYYPTEIFEKANIKAELLTCAVGKYINVGGFDMQKREPKPMQKAVPAGTVYYFRLETGSLQDLANELQKNGISEYNQNEGFGIAYIGKI
jgi:CRISPR-associated protein Cmr3